MTDRESPARLAAHSLRSPAHGWSVGVSGALGEFMYDEDEPVHFGDDGEVISAVTRRGAIRITLPPDATCCAMEGMHECTGGWSQAVGFCVPAGASRGDHPDVLSELGADRDALTPEGQAQVLFDLGLGDATVRFCIRTGDSRLIDTLRAASGRSIFAQGNTVSAVIREASPVRVVTSGVGRVEVFQDIPERGGGSPRGPHTHLLPGLLKRQGQDAVPPGWVAPLKLHPQHPTTDKYGDPTPFNHAAHRNFQALLARHGNAGYLDAKARFTELLLQGPLPDSAIPDRGHPDWIAYSVALNQFSCQRADAQAA